MNQTFNAQSSVKPALTDNEEPMQRLRVLILGPDCNPDSVSIPLVSYCHADALSQIHDVTLVVRSSVETNVRRAAAPFRDIEVVRMPIFDRVFAWCFRKIFKNNYESQLLTAFKYPFSIAFEWKAWRQLRKRIFAGEFDVVLRLVPITAVLPSPFAFFLRKGPIPFVIGPVSGGLPWPPGFKQLEKQKEWVSGLRKLYKDFPFARSTYLHASAIIAASSQTYAEFDQYREKLFFIPENGIAPAVCFSGERMEQPETPLDLIFVGGLVPRKACDMALRAAAPLLQKGAAHFTVVGDGPERSRLEALAASLGVQKAVSFSGWISHAEVLARLQKADVLVFPSVRDFGGGVVFEALASGTVPVVVDFGGPGDIVSAESGFKVQMTNEEDMVSRMENILANLADDRELLLRFRRAGMAYARDSLTWEAKAQNTSRVLQWVVGKGLKPYLPPPKFLNLNVAN